MKKNVCHFQPAKVDRWTEKGLPKIRITYYQTNPNTGEIQRFRPTFGLNRKRLIASGQQEFRAKEILKQINKVLPMGYPFIVDLDGNMLIEEKEKTPEVIQPDFKKVNVLEALDYGLKIICSEKAGNTVRTRENIIRKLKEFIEAKKLEKMKIGDWNYNLSIGYLDHVQFERNAKWRTWNNNLRVCRKIMIELRKRGYVKDNFFGDHHIKYKKGKGLEHKVLPLEEARIIIQHFYENDKFLFYFLLIQFIGFARPVEIRERLKRHHFKLGKGLIEVPGKQRSKSTETKWLTIKNSVLKYFMEPWFFNIPSHFFIFGEGNEPSPYNAAGEHSIYNRYRKKIKTLYKNGLISHPYTQLYDWKRRGITEELKVSPLPEVQRQAGHEKAESTLIYHQPEIIQHGIKNSTTPLI